jgi:glyoxylase-like metal-dependent hydrolase (beta-lactamase superfamily II)
MTGRWPCGDAGRRDTGPGRLPPAAPTVRPVEEGAALDLGGHRFELFHLPGHSPGQIDRWDADSRVLIGGDANYERGLIDTLPHSDRATYRRTMERLLTLDPTETLGGHGGPLSPSRFREEIEAYLAATA